MNWVIVFQIVGILIFVLLGVVGSLLVFANSQTNPTEARVRAMLGRAGLMDAHAAGSPPKKK